MTKFTVLVLVLVLTAPCLAQLEVVVGEEEVVGLAPEDNNYHCQSYVINVTRIWQDSNDFRVEERNAYFRPTRVGFQTDSITLKVDYNAPWKSGCPPYAYFGKRYSGIGTTDSILRIRPKILNVDMIPDTNARVYIGSFELSFGNNINASADFKNWSIADFDNSLYDFVARVDSQVVTEISSAPFQQLQKVHFDLVFRIGPFWTDTTIPVRFLTYVDSQLDSTYSNTINLVFHKLSKSSFIESSHSLVKEVLQVGDKKTVHITAKCHPTIDSFTSSTVYPFKVENLKKSGDTYEFDLLLGPAPRGPAWTDLPLKWLWNDFSGKTRYDSIIVPLIIGVYPLQIVPSSINFRGPRSELKDIAGRILNQPSMTNIKVRCKPPLTAPSVSIDPDSIRFTLLVKAVHADFYQDSFWVDFDVIDAYGNSHPENSSVGYVIDVDFDEWSRTNWPDSLPIQYIAAAGGDSVYVISSDAVYASLNAGRTWELIKQFTLPVTSFVINTAGDLAVILDSTKLQIHIAEDNWADITDGLSITSAGTNWYNLAQPNRLFAYGDNLLLRARWRGFPRPSVYGNFLVKKNNFGKYICTDIYDCNKRLRVVVNTTNSATDKFSCQQDDLFNENCPVKAMTPTNDEFPIEFIWEESFTGDSTGIWRNRYTTWDKFSTDKLIDIRRRKNRLAIACSDNTILGWTNSVNSHRFKVGLEGLPIAKVAPGDTIFYVATKDNKIYRTYLAGDILSIRPEVMIHQANLIIWPNPAVNRIEYELPKGLVIRKQLVINEFGIPLLQKNEPIESTIDVSSLCSGAYTLLCYSESQVFWSPFIIAR